MRRFRHRQFRIENLALGGVSVLIIVLATTYIFGSIYINGLGDETYLRLLNRRHEKVSDNFSYTFLSGVRGQFGPSEPFNLKLTTLKYDGRIIDFIKSTDESILNEGQKIELLQKVDNETRLWDCDRLNSTRCLTTKQIEKAFGNWEFEDSWTKFRSVYGDGGYHQFSVPIYDDSRQYVAVQHVIKCGDLCGEEELLLFKLMNGQWTVISKEGLWIS